MDDILSAPIIEVENFIGGQFVPAECHLESFNPATGEVWANVIQLTQMGKAKQN